MPENLEDVILDHYAPLSHKRALGDASVPGRAWLAPSYVPEADKRRFAAYKVLHAYRRNVARFFGPSQNERELRERREYGDVDTMLKIVRAAVLGDDVQLVVARADEDLPEDEDAPAEGEDAGDQAIDRAEIEAARALQDVLRQWMVDERVVRKIYDGEDNALALGDAMYELGLSTRRGRPILRSRDPGFYVPVLDDEDDEDEEFPTTVHRVWEIEQRNADRSTDTYVRLRTWRLGPIVPRVTVDEETGEETVTLPDDTTWDEERGRYVRRYPWHVDEGESSDVTCYMTDASWPLARIDSTELTFFDPEKAIYRTNEDGQEIRDLDLEVDVIPVVHLPNMGNEEEHFGDSLILLVAQALDDLTNALTDLSKASGTTGQPMVALIGGVLHGVDDQGNPTDDGTAEYRPGGVWNLPKDGDLKSISTADALDALLKYIEFLIKHILVQLRLPAEALGRVAAGDVASGILLALSFGPMRTLIRELRLIREEKYRLMLRIVQKLMMAGGLLPPGRLLEARFEFGSFLPAERAEAIAQAKDLYGANLISRIDAVQMLVAAGVLEDEASVIVERIEREDFEGAAQLFQALNDDDEVWRYLHREPPAEQEGEGGAEGGGEGEPPTPEELGLPPQ